MRLIHCGDFDRISISEGRPYRDGTPRYFSLSLYFGRYSEASDARGNGKKYLSGLSYHSKMTREELIELRDSINEILE